MENTLRLSGSFMFRDRLGWGSSPCWITIEGVKTDAPVVMIQNYTNSPTYADISGNDPWDKQFGPEGIIPHLQSKRPDVADIKINIHSPEEIGDDEDIADILSLLAEAGVPLTYRTRAEHDAHARASANELLAWTGVTR